MDEQNIRGLIEEVRGGKLARRDFMLKMVSLGITAPMAGHLLLNPVSLRRKHRQPTSPPNVAAAVHSKCCGGRAPRS